MGATGAGHCGADVNFGVEGGEGDGDGVGDPKKIGAFLFKGIGAATAGADLKFFDAEL